MRPFPALIFLPVALGLGFLVGKPTAPLLEQPVAAPIPTPLPVPLPADPDAKRFTGTMEELLNTAETAAGRGNPDYLIMRAMEDADAKQLAQWAAELRALRERHYWYNVQHEVLRRWSEEDSNAALAWMMGLPAAEKKLAIWQLLPALADRDPKRALAAAAALTSETERADARQAIVEGLAKSDPKSALALDLTLPKRDGAINAIFQSWGKLDPAAAMEALASLPAGYDRSNAIHGCFQSWAKHDPAGALAAAAKLPSQQEQKEATRSAFYAWFGKDQASAMTWLETLPAAERTPLANESIWGALALTDPERASALISGFSGYDRTNAFKEMAKKLSGQNLDHALSWAMSLPPEDQRSALSDLGPQVASGGADKLLWLADRLPEGMGRFEFLQKSLLSTGKDRPELVKSVLAGITEDEAAKLMQNVDLVSYLGRADPLAAEAWLTELSPSAKRHWATQNAAEIAATDPQAALQWASQLPAEQQESAFASVLPKLAETDGPAAYQQALLIQAANPKSETLEHVLQAWMNKDPEGPEKLLPELTGEAREFVQYRVAAQKIRDDPDAGITHLLTLVQSGKEEDSRAAITAVSSLGYQAMNDPASATAWFNRIPEGEMQTSYLAGLANDWLRENSPACLAWLDQLPEGKTRELGTITFAETWINQNVEEAGEWIATLPAGNPKDQLARKMTDRLYSDHPDQAAEWASRIQGTKAREEALQFVFYNWLNRDRGAATQALQKATLREEIKAELLHPSASESNNADPSAPE